MRWKIWISGARLEIRAGQCPDRSVVLLKQGLADAPKKAKACVYIESSRLQEFSGCLDQARQFLEDGKRDSGLEWKVGYPCVFPPTPRFVVF